MSRQAEVRETLSLHGMEDFLGELMVCVLIALICIYLFVRFNTYSHLYNPDHPKPGDKV